MAKRPRAEQRRPAKRAPESRAPARIASAIELSDAIAAADRGAEAVIAAFLRQRPWIKGGDLGKVLAWTEQVLRQRAALDWWIARQGHGLEPSGRTRLLVLLAMAEGRSEAMLRELFAAGTAAPLTRPEAALLAAVAGQPLLQPAMPLPVRASFPAFLAPALRQAFGANLELEMLALAEPAPLDLRVNTLQADRPAVIAALAAEGLHPVPTPLSPIGLRLSRRLDLGRLAALRAGIVEPQDEGSQIAALLVAAAPGQFVIDACAGAGGKTLALAAAMQGRGRLVAADRSLGRLDRAGLRLRRAGAFNVERRDSRDRKWLKRQAGRADRVLVDAPCSGIGSWRRIPDARWRLQEPDIPELVALQRELLDEAARLVAPGGRLVYVTCSVLPAENREQIDAFLSRWPGFRLLPVPAVWSAVIGGRCPVEDAVLQLTPLRHGTGGFFVAILERRRD